MGEVTPSASIIIAAYNRFDDLRECLDSPELKNLDPALAEIIVVDDASTDGTPDALGPLYPNITLLSTRHNVGPGQARNLAAQHSRGNTLVFLDSDAVPEPGWLKALLANDDGKTLLVGRVVDYTTGEVQYGPRRATFLGKSLRCPISWANTGGAGNMALPKSLFEEVGGFDPELSNCFEDSYLCIRIKRRGGGFNYVPSAVIRHKGDVHKHGHEIYLQEYNSTYGMLKIYKNAPAKRALFSLFNGIWVFLRFYKWLLSKRPSDAWQLLNGWRDAYKRFERHRTT